MKLIDSKIWELGYKIYDFIIINLLWMVFSTPLITIGPATNAGLKCIKEIEENSSQNIFKIFFKHFTKDIISISLVFNTFLIGIIISSIFFINLFKNGNLILTSICLFIIYELILAMSAIFMIEDPIDLTIKSIIYGNKNMIKVVLNMVLCVCVLFLCINFTPLIPISIALCLFISNKVIYSNTLLKF